MSLLVQGPRIISGTSSCYDNGLNEQEVLDIGDDRRLQIFRPTLQATNIFVLRQAPTWGRRIDVHRNAHLGVNGALGSATVRVWDVPG